MRGVEHLLYLVKFPAAEAPAGRAAAIEPARQRFAPKEKPVCNKY